MSLRRRSTSNNRDSEIDCPGKVLTFGAREIWPANDVLSSICVRSSVDYQRTINKSAGQLIAPFESRVNPPRQLPCCAARPGALQTERRLQQHRPAATRF